MKEVLMIIIPGMIGFVASEFLSWVKRKEDSKERLLHRKEDSKERLLLGNYILRQNAYVNLHKALKEYEFYFRQFTNPGSDFLVSENLENFAPLQDFDRFKVKIEDEELWFDSQTNKLIDQLKEQSYFACSLTSLIQNEISIDSDCAVTSQCNSIIDIIDLINEHLKDITGMKDLDTKMEYFFPSEK